MASIPWPFDGFLGWLKVVLLDAIYPACYSENHEMEKIHHFLVEIKPKKEVIAGFRLMHQ
jgi:hypothetical protein